MCENGDLPINYSSFQALSIMPPKFLSFRQKSVESQDEITIWKGSVRINNPKQPNSHIYGTLEFLLSSSQLQAYLKWTPDIGSVYYSTTFFLSLLNCYLSCYVEKTVHKSF